MDRRKTRFIVLFNRELRLHDNHLLSACLSHENAEVLPLFSFQPFLFQDKDLRWNTLICGDIRKKFYLEAVSEFQSSLRNIGLDLLVSRQKYSELVPLLIDPNQQNIILISDDFINDIHHVCTDIVDSLDHHNIDHSSYQIQSLWGNCLLDIKHVSHLLSQIQMATFR